MQGSVGTVGSGMKQSIKNYFTALRFLLAFYLSESKLQPTKCRFNSSADLW